MSLKEYNKKRNFTDTDEPQGKVKKSAEQRFVIQYHQARTKHYDFRLEYNGVLLSWAIPKGLSLNPKVKRLAVHVEDHPVDYIDFEGVIPKGNYGAGTVEIYDSGYYAPIKDVGKGMKSGQIKFVLSGEKFKGAWTLIKTDGDNWLAVKISDEYANTKAVKQKNVKLPFNKCEVMLATLSRTLPKGKEWVAEIKYDGYRIVSYRDKNKVTMYTRNGVNYTEKFDVIAKALKKIDSQSFVVDGEIVVFDKAGRSDFGLLQQSVKNQNGGFFYVIFDLLALDGEDLRGLPLLKRKAKLERLLHGVDERVKYSVHVDDIAECLKFSKENNLEGVVVKKINSEYVGGRSENWLKIKNSLRQEFVIGGYTVSQKNELISALLLGYYSGKNLIYVGKVGTGLTENDRELLSEKFAKIKTEKSPFNDKVKESNGVWLKPVTVAEIQYAELTKDGHLRQPSFIGLRADKKAKDVVLET